MHRAGLPIQVRFSTLKKPNILLLLSVVLCLPLMAPGPHFQADEHDKILHNRGCLLAQLMNLFRSQVSGLKTSVPSKCVFLFNLLMNRVLGTIFSDWSSSQPQLNSIHICNTTRTESQRRDLTISTCWESCKDFSYFKVN